MPIPQSGEYGAETEQEALKRMVFGAIEETLDFAVKLGHYKEPAFVKQLEYAAVLANIDEPEHAEAHFTSALGAVEDGVAGENYAPSRAATPGSLREQAELFSLSAVKLNESDWHDVAKIAASEAKAKLELSLTAETFERTPGSDIFRYIREQDCIITVANALATIGDVDESEALRLRARHDLDTYTGHLSVLQTQKNAAGSSEQPETNPITEQQEDILYSVKEVLEELLEDETKRPKFRVENIIQLYVSAKTYGLDIDVIDLLERYESFAQDDQIVDSMFFDVNAEQPRYRRSPIKTRKLADKYRLLAEAYYAIDETEKAKNVLSAHLMPLVMVDIYEKGVVVGEDLEALAEIYLELGIDDKAEALIDTTGFRYRLDLRKKQAMLALKGGHVSETVNLLDTAVGELELRFLEDEPPEDEYDIGMGLEFARLYGQIGEYEKMDATYRMLEERNAGNEYYNFMRGENDDMHLPIARSFIAAGNIRRSFEVIQNANDIDQATFLIELANIMFADNPASLESQYVERGELFEALAQFSAYRQERRLS